MNYYTPKETTTERDYPMLKAVFESSAEGILMISEEGKIVKANPASEKIFGYPTSQLNGLTVATVLPDFLQSYLGYHNSQTGQSENREQNVKLMGLHKEGTELSLEIRCRPTDYENIVITFLKPVVEDHPDTNAPAEKPWDHPEPAALNRHLPGVLYRCNNDTDRSMLYISDSVAHLTGYPATAFYQSGKNLSFQRLIHPDDRQRVTDKMQMALQQRNYYALTYRIITKHKKEKWVWEHGYGVYTEQATFMYWEGMLLEVSDPKEIPIRWQAGEMKLRDYAVELEQKVKERTRELTATVKKLVETNLNLEYQIQETKAADAQAKKNHALYVAIARYFPKVMIVVINRDYEIVFLDGEELRKTGLDKEVVEGWPIKDIKNFSAEWKHRMIEHAQKSFGGGHFSYEIKYKNNNYKVNTMPLDDGQLGVNLVLFVFTNMTEQKRTELKMLKALKKERELSELKSRFVSMASHEFRTPLSTILSAANLIARQNEPGKEEKRLLNVERIKSSVKNLVDILNEFLSIGRLEEGEVSMKKEVFDLISFMKSIIQELQHVQKEGQQVRLISKEKKMQVYLDKQFTRNVFLNLISNALKYSPAHRPVDILINAEADTLTVKVQDQGIGIPEDEQQNLFNLFFRARNVTNIEGTGLGLPIVKKYMELMHGKITFESKLQHGSTFTILLPYDPHGDEKNSIDRR